MIANSFDKKKESSRATNWFLDLWLDIKKNKSIYFLAIPGIIYYLLFHYGPMYGVLMSFVDYSPAKGISGSDWVGLKYFAEFFEGVYAWRTIRNTLLINLYMLIFKFPLGIILALLMNELRSAKFKKTVQTVTYLPHFISAVVVCGLVVQFTASGGLITEIVNSIAGTKYGNLLYEEDLYRTIYVATTSWHTVGWSSIIYMAALSGLDMQLYEAAEIDGAGKMRQFWHITLPGILPTIVTMLILQIGQMMSLGSEQTILLYNEVVYEKADVISSFVYRQGLARGEYSYSTAVGLFNSLVNLILVFSANKFSKLVNGYGIF